MNEIAFDAIDADGERLTKIGNSEWGKTHLRGDLQIAACPPPVHM